MLLAAWQAVEPALPKTSCLQVPNDVLKGWVLLRARVQQGMGLPFAAEAQTHEFYLLRWARRQLTLSGGAGLALGLR